MLQSKISAWYVDVDVDGKDLNDQTTEALSDNQTINVLVQKNVKLSVSVSLFM